MKETDKEYWMITLGAILLVITCIVFFKLGMCDPNARH